jgi:hypothetical protein
MAALVWLSENVLMTSHSVVKELELADVRISLKMTRRG